VIEALRFGSPRFELLETLTTDEWRMALSFSDRSQLTLPLGLSCGEHLPDLVRSRIDGNLANMRERWRRIKNTYCEIAAAFDAAGLEFVVLKGFTNCPRFVREPWHRRQGDLDVLFEQERVEQAYAVAQGIGYAPITPGDQHPMNHLPTLVRKTGWEWSGDHFAADIPISLELHFQIWSSEMERFTPAGLEHFWARRERRVVDGLACTTLHPADTVANATLHLLGHLLRGRLQPSHVYELAWMLDRSADDAAFWNSWRELHDESLRRIESICFSIAQRWFDCRVSGVAQEEIQRLPGEVQRWLETYSLSPLVGKFHPNKDELWLHWSLLETARDKLAVARRRLIPERLPGPVDALYVPDDRRTWKVRLRSRMRYLAFASRRAVHHVRALPPTAWSGLKWFGGRLELGSDYWRFLLAEAFFDVGMFIFVFLYSLYLLQIGFDEKFVGLVTSTMTVGSIGGTILSALLMRRFGTQRTLLAAFALVAMISALRASATSASALLGLAFAGGLASSAWPVALAPVVANVTTDKNRPLGFSLVCSSGVGIGILAALIAGRLPGWMSHLSSGLSAVASYRASMLFGCGFVLLAMWPFSRVTMGPAPPPTRKFQRPSPIVIRFLTAMAAWSVGTAMFNPFHNVFFARMHMTVQQIGYTVSSAQFAQVVAMLLAPIVFRKFGLIRGVSGMQFATGLMLLALAASISPTWAAIAYAAFMMVQYMSEPGMFTLLMESVKESDRSTASALNFLVSFGGHAIAAALAGVFIARVGYPPVLIAAAIICAGAALLFRVLLAKSAPDSEGAR
jgi:MFS family permease